MSTSEKFATEASAQLAAVLNLPPASGTVRNIVDALIRATIAAIDDRQAIASRKPTLGLKPK